MCREKTNPSALCTATTVRRSAEHMNRLHIFFTTVLLTIILQLPSYAVADRLTVVASVFPLFEFAREVAGPAADVRLLLPPGVDPHSWEPKPSDIVDLTRADIFLYTSEKMEPWAGDIARAVKGRGVALVQVTGSLGVSGNAHGEDPHFWLDLSLSVGTIKMIGNELSERDPENRDQYMANTVRYTRKLQQLDEAYKTGLKECESRHLVTGGHAAFGHLTRRYGLEQISVYGLSPDAEPTPRHLAGIVSVVKESGVRTIFSEELMNPRMAQVLSRETGARVMVLNPGANLTAAQWREGLAFIDIMSRNLDTLREGLSCE